MDVYPLLRGALIGLAIAAPVGPIGLLCIQRTLERGRAHGLASGLGAATADTVYGVIAALGLTAVSRVLVGQAAWLRVLGGIAMVALGWRTLRRRPGGAPAHAPSRGLAGAWASTLALTLTNPMTIVSFTAIMAGLGLGARDGLGASAAWVAGVFLGSSLWWLALSTAVALLRSRLPEAALRWIRVTSNVVIVALGLLALAAALAPA